MHFRTAMLGAIAAGSLFACGVGSAAATEIEYAFTGHITAEDTTGPLRNEINPNFNTSLDTVTGALIFDVATAPTSPGQWTLTGAQFDVTFASGLTLDFLGVNAHTGANAELLAFTSSNLVGQTPNEGITSATLSLGLESFIDNFFSLTNLPTTIPTSIDHGLGISYTTASGPGAASTDTNLVVTAMPVPEPAAILVLASGLAGLLALRRRPARG